MTEFTLIQKYCKDIGSVQAETVISVGDDAAVVNIPSGKEIVVSVDSLVEGVHFFAGTKAQNIAHKLVAVNLSDMAAMGALPKWVTLALTIPKHDNVWLSEFSKGLDRICKQYKVQLIGGDTCQGPLVLSLQVMGIVDKGEALTRSSARVGDDVYVSGNLGDASLALAAIQDKVQLSNNDLQLLRFALDKPTPQVKLGQHLIGLANSCIDISDGLIGDLSHIALQSGVSIKLDVESLPLSEPYTQYLTPEGDLGFALNGGEDYQLAFTAAATQRKKIDKISAKLGIKLTKVGKVLTKSAEMIMLSKNGQVFTLSNNKSYQHFSEN